MSETEGVARKELERLRLDEPDGAVPTSEADGEADGASDDSGTAVGDAGQQDAKKKKKKKKGKKKKSKAAALSQAREKQSSPPRIPLAQLFPSGQYPEGETCPYPGDNSFRTTSEEKRHLERLMAQEDPDSPNNYNSIRRAAEAHRQVRRYAREHIKVGMSMTDIANMIEDGTRALVEADGRQRGVGFPTGLSRNHCAAHFTPNFGDTTVLEKGDVLKVDIGVQVNGRICDSAFTLNFNEDGRYDNLLKAVQAATEAGVKDAGIDARLSDLGASIQEVMESYEVELNGNVKPVKAIRNLTGHSILPWRIHGGKSVPIVRNSNEEGKMEEGEYFAIETFGSTGKGFVVDEGECSHYAKLPNSKPIRLASAKALMNRINQEFGTLPFCRRYLDRVGENPPDYYPALENLVKYDYLQDYPPLSDEAGCMTAQFEHTILLRPTCKEIVSRGDDY